LVNDFFHNGSWRRAYGRGEAPAEVSTSNSPMLVATAIEGAIGYSSHKRDNSEAITYPLQVDSMIRQILNKL
jgi:hypothetical protein